MKRTIVLLLLTIAAWASATVREARADGLYYEGTLQTDGGDAMEEALLLFQLYDVPEGGTALWEASGTTNVYPDTSTGAFTCEIPVPDATLAGLLAGAPDGLWLAIRCDGVWLTPRQRLSASPYAIAADIAKKALAGALSVTNDLQPDAVTADVVTAHRTVCAARLTGVENLKADAEIVLEGTVFGGTVSMLRTDEIAVPGGVYIRPQTDGLYEGVADLSALTNPVVMCYGFTRGTNLFATETRILTDGETQHRFAVPCPADTVTWLYYTNAPGFPAEAISWSGALRPFGAGAGY